MVVRRRREVIQIFSSYGKRNYSNKCINRIKLDDESTTADQKQIIEQMNRFYKKLYSTVQPETNNENFFNIASPKLSEEAKLKCEGPISEEELFTALKSSAKCKTPGNEGFSVEFYLTFWEDIKQYLIKSIYKGKKTGILTASQRQEIITLIPKKEKDPLYVKNWRPISLLNTEYKLIAKCLANRALKYMGELIHSDQTGFLPRRYIGENINKIIGLKLYIMVPLVPLLTMDVYFIISRGVRQRCPLSPYLFVLASEILAINIRTNQKIKGININNVCTKIIQYADDTCLPLAYDKQSLSEVI